MFTIIFLFLLNTKRHGGRECVDFLEENFAPTLKAMIMSDNIFDEQSQFYRYISSILWDVK